jgi:hypothetical protein
MRNLNLINDKGATLSSHKHLPENPNDQEVDISKKSKIDPEEKIQI